MIAEPSTVRTGEKPAQRLFVPGPTDVLPEVMLAQTEPMIGHRSVEFESLFAKVQEQLRRLFNTESRVYVVAATGSGLHEAAIRNGVGGRVVSFVNGAFGQRWYDIARACDKEAVRVEVEWNTAVKAETVRDALSRAVEGGPVDAITVVHNETSTGVLSPIDEISEVVREISPSTLVMVDAVSSLSGTNVAFDAWDLDICLTSSQKALALPPGLALCAVSDRMLDRASSVSGRGWYFDFVRLEKYLQRDTTPATPAISLIRALSVQLDVIFSEGLEERFARHHYLAGLTQQWVVQNGFDLAAEEGYRSPTVTNVVNRRNVDIADLNQHLGQEDMLISNGYGPFKNRMFRIAHMGEVQESDLQRLFTAMEAYLRSQPD